MEEKNMSIKERLIKVLDETGKIQVPIALADQISRPLVRCLYLIQTCVDELPDEKKEVE